MFVYVFILKLSLFVGQDSLEVWVLASPTYDSGINPHVHIFEKDALPLRAP